MLIYNDLDLNNQKILCLPSIFQFEKTVHNLDPTGPAFRPRRVGAHDAARVYDTAPAGKNKVLQLPRNNRRAMTLPPYRDVIVYGRLLIVLDRS